MEQTRPAMAATASRRAVTLGLVGVGSGALLLASGTANVVPGFRQAWAAPGLAFASPAAATPTLAAEQRLTVRLAPGSGNDWCIYNGRSSQPAPESGRAATIAGVTNLTDLRITLNYFGPSGSREGPVSIAPGAGSPDFDGADLAGLWEAAVGGLEEDAPPKVVLEIGYELEP